MAGYNIGPTIGIDGEAEFRQQLKDINTGLKTLGSEMTVVTTAFLGQEKSVEGLAAKNDVLSRSLSSLNERLELEEQMLKASAQAYGESDERTQKWQQSVNKTQAEINKANAQIAQNTSLMEELGETSEETAEKEEKAADRSVAASNRRGEALKKLGKVAAAAALAVGGAIGVLVGQSLEAYASYEQLVGGVETLFGQSADIVQAYADRAYKTAGLTANKYMETVTSFSASLINSLGGDTARAAQLADQAIVDMSDNANKMGTDISMLQNAYQGFAKQNYTMLDNLKLGYGGTKEEMERLLETAGRLSGTTYNIESFADIVEAIHVVQTEMGITGTTAAEAASTIEGSVNSMKAAWGNLVTGMARDDADLDLLIDQFVESVGTAAQNIIPRLETALSGMSEVIVALAPMIQEQLPALMDAILPGLIAATTTLIQALAMAIPDMLPVLAEAAMMAVDMVGAGIAEKIPALAAIFNNLSGVITVAAAAFVGFKTAAAVGSLMETLTKTTEGLTLAQAALNAVLNANPFAIIAGLIAGVVTIMATLFATNEEFRQQIVDIWDAIVTAVQTAVDKIGEIIGGIKNAFSSVVDGVKSLLGIHSPSRVFRDIGKNMAAGLGAGWDNSFPGIQRDIEKSMTFDAMGAGDWGRQIAGNMEMDLTGPTYAGRMDATAAQTAAVVASQGNQGGDIVLNVTETIDGAVLARNQYRYNQREAQLHGPALVKGG